MDALTVEIGKIDQTKSKQDSSVSETAFSVFRTKRKKNFGVTLIEVMIVVVILALLATAAGLALIPRLNEARIKSSKSDAQAIRSAVTLFLVENPGTCPSMEKLVEAGIMDSSKRVTDAWNREYQIKCEGDNIMVTSAGPDGQFGTEDDVK